MYILLAMTCSDCGGDMAVKRFDSEPSDNEVKEVKDAIGGNVCIKSFIFELKKDYEDKDEISIITPD